MYSIRSFTVFFFISKVPFVLCVTVTIVTHIMTMSEWDTWYNKQSIAQTIVIDWGLFVVSYNIACHPGFRTKYFDCLVRTSAKMEIDANSDMMLLVFMKLISSWCFLDYQTCENIAKLNVHCSNFRLICKSRKLPSIRRLIWYFRHLDVPPITLKCNMAVVTLNYNYE